MLNCTKEALEAYTKAIQLDPTTPGLYYRKGNLLKRRGFYGQAYFCYKYAATLEPTEALYYVGLGDVLMILKRSAEALTAYTQAIRLDHNRLLPQ